MIDLLEEIGKSENLFIIFAKPSIIDAQYGPKYLNMLNRRSMKIKRAKHLSEQKQDDLHNARTSPKI